MQNTKLKRNLGVSGSHRVCEGVLGGSFDRVSRLRDRGPGACDRDNLRLVTRTA